VSKAASIATDLHTLALRPLRDSHLILQHARLPP